MDQAAPPVPHHPASSGVAEGTIGVHTSDVRAMLHYLGIPKSILVEAFSTATYIRNRTLTKVLDGRKRYEMLYDDVKPDLANLRTFGAPCAIVGPSEELKKHARTVTWATSIGGEHVMHVYGGSLAKLTYCGRSLPNFKHISQSMLL